MTIVFDVTRGVYRYRDTTLTDWLLWGTECQMGAITRREFGRFAAEVGALGVSGALTACGSPAPPRSKPTAITTTEDPQPRTRPTRLTQADLDRIIGDHAHTLLDRLRAKAPGPNYGAAVAFAYPHHQFNPFYMYGTVAEKTPPTERTIFGIASITKTLTAGLFANGVAARPDCFDWDAGLQRYLDEYLGGGLSPTVQQITPRMLAQHTSGLARQAQGPQDGVGLFQKDPSTVAPGVLRVWRTHGGPQPGSCWLYSNLGYFTLGFAAVSAYSRAAGGSALSYRRLLRDQITGPLNMPDTVTVVPDGAPVARAHPNGGAVSAGDAPDIKSSAADMHTWLLAHLDAVSGPPNLMEGLASTTRPTPLSVDVCGQTTRGPAHMGLAWQMEPGPPQIIWKDGLTSVGGCASWIGFTPPGPSQQPLGIAILVNGYWNKDKPAVLPDNHGPAMLKEIAAAL